MTTLCDAELSACGLFRYWLVREWDSDKPILVFCMLNPSTADASKDDATIRACVRRAQQAGYGGIHVVNLFAFRATNPVALRVAKDPIGRDNDQHIRDAAEVYGDIVCAWGNHGQYGGRGAEVLRMLRAMPNKPRLYHLGITKSQQPTHPLYISNEVSLTLW